MGVKIITGCVTAGRIREMDLKVLHQNFTICKVENIKDIDFTDKTYFIGKTDEEISLVCSTKCVPEKTVKREDGWKAFRIQGVLDFSLVGILSRISGVLAENQIGIFAVSTFHTDYILTKEEDFEKAIQVLREQGYQIVR